MRRVGEVVLIIGALAYAVAASWVIASAFDWSALLVGLAGGLVSVLLDRVWRYRVELLLWLSILCSESGFPRVGLWLLRRGLDADAQRPQCERIDPGTTEGR